ACVAVYVSPLTLPPPPRSTLFPYTTLFRSSRFLLREPSRAPRPHCWPPPPSWVSQSPSWFRRPVRLRHSQASSASSARSAPRRRSEEHTSELQSRENLVCRLLLEKKKKVPT